jgi:hypothetical protein
MTNVISFNDLLLWGGSKVFSYFSQVKCNFIHNIRGNLIKSFKESIKCSNYFCPLLFCSHQLGLPM